jgi:hypothetical protein
MVVISQVANVAGKVLFALSVFCGLVALRTRPAPMYTPRELPD